MVLQEAMLSLVGVAQLVESRIVIPVVVGSSPIVHPIPFAVGPIRSFRAILNIRRNSEHTAQT